MKTQSHLASSGFFAGNRPDELVAQFGSPLYVYSEAIFRQRCRDMQQLVDYEHFTANYSIKANSNLHLLAIAREEGMYADAMSPGEILFLRKPGSHRSRFSLCRTMFPQRNCSLPSTTKS